LRLINFSFSLLKKRDYSGGSVPDLHGVPFSSIIVEPEIVYIIIGKRVRVKINATWRHFMLWFALCRVVYVVYDGGVRS